MQRTRPRGSRCDSPGVGAWQAAESEGQYGACLREFARPVPDARVPSGGMRRLLLPLAASLLLLAAACGGVQAQTQDRSRIVRLQVVADGFDQPVAVAAAPGDPRLFVIEQHTGRVLLVERGRRSVLLNLGRRISTGGEQGLLGIALAPDFGRSGHVVLDYTDTRGATHVVRYTLRGTRLVAPALLLKVAQPFANHNGGHVVFGPDGRLWVGLGDGGSAGDPGNRAQNPRVLLGKLLRLDVDRPGSSPQVWATGLRNPWRYSFDGRMLWIGDVGQDAFEEVNRVDTRAPAGVNFGWPRYEGLHEYRNPDQTAPARYVAPIAEYSHDQGCSITGGIVVHDARLGALDDHYVYADFCSGRLWMLPADAPARGAVPTEITERLGGPLGGLASFGTDGAGRPLVVLLDGRVLRLVRP